MLPMGPTAGRRNTDIVVFVVVVAAPVCGAVSPASCGDVFILVFLISTMGATMAAAAQRRPLLAVLPPRRFQNGHTFFIQHVPHPIAVHATHNYDGLEGKRERLRSAAALERAVRERQGLLLLEGGQWMWPAPRLGHSWDVEVGEHFLGTLISPCTSLSE